ncbi:hypothetical protein LCGC14_0627980 [marine sediment metagenome]|uniref:DUF5659 domain-containing protein n=1 Tax=marine sediment metagenome TaxID=412755 RepID=A0A0F9UBE3_9ZZZZ
MTQTDNNKFRTSDTALAAFLVAEGSDTPELEFNGNRASFIFAKDNPKINIVLSISNWDTARATTNAVLFFNAYQTLLRRIKERY